VNVAKRISCLGFIFLLGALALRAEDFSDNATNAGDANLIAAAPPAISETVSNSAAAATNSVSPVVAAATSPNLPAAAPAQNILLWIGLACVTVLSLSAMVFSWSAARRRPAAPMPASSENLPVPVAHFLPLISLTVKETLAHELAAQRRELLAAQQAATLELAQLARRLEAIQTPLLERQHNPRLGHGQATSVPRETTVKIFCECGQKYSFEIQPADGRMPFPVACPACGQDGTAQAENFLARILHGHSQPLPPPPIHTLLQSSPPGFAPQFVEAMKEAAEKIPANGREKSNGTPAPANHTGNCVANLLAEGGHLLEAGKYDSALKCFDTALALQPERADTLVKMGSAFDRLGRTDDALNSFNRAIELDDTLATAYLNKGGIYNRLARYDEALQCYEQALLKQKKSVA
jgi:tetratricopeptide (TPR) repeat protein